VVVVLLVLRNKLVSFSGERWLKWYTELNILVIVLLDKLGAFLEGYRFFALGRLRLEE